MNESTKKETTQTVKNEFVKKEESKNKVAVVAIVGRPSAGKSTFLNTACGEKVSIVSPMPQTTRNSIRGIVHGSRGQLVFIDTPGYHESEKKLNLKLQSIAAEQLAESDLILYIIDSTRETGSEEELIATLLKPLQNKIVIAINKTDSKDSKTGMSKLFITKMLPEISTDRVFEISASKDTNIDPLLIKLFDLAPYGDLLYPEEFYTDQEVSFRVAEVIREKAILSTRDEIPHCLYVDIVDAEFKKNGKELWVRASLVVERDSQKAMVIGKGASMIKSIRLAAEKELNQIFPYRVSLDLQVKVSKNWRQKDEIIKKLS